MVAVVGEPGVGKSRLVYEFTHSHRTQGWLDPGERLGLLRQGHAVSAGHRPAQGATSRSRTATTPRTIREKVTGKLLTLDERLRADPARRSWRCSTCPSRTPQWQALDPPQRRQRTLDAVKRLLLRESQVQPLLLVFEDLHWIDAETQALLDSLVESLPDGPRSCSSSTTGPSTSTRWGSKTYYTPAPARPAAAGERRGAARTRCSGDDPSLAAAQAAADRADRGQSLLPGGERADPGGDRGAGRRARRLSAGASRSQTIQVPATVQAVLAARIDRLPPEDKRLLQTAAVIGKDVPFALLQAIAELPEDDAAPRARPPAGRRVPLRDAASSPSSSTPSSTR